MPKTKKATCILLFFSISLALIVLRPHFNRKSKYCAVIYKSKSNERFGPIKKAFLGNNIDFETRISPWVGSYKWNIEIKERISKERHSRNFYGEQAAKVLF